MQISSQDLNFVRQIMESAFELISSNVNHCSNEDDGTTANNGYTNHLELSMI